MESAESAHCQVELAEAESARNELLRVRSQLNERLEELEPAFAHLSQENDKLRSALFGTEEQLRASKTAEARNLDQVRRLEADVASLRRTNPTPQANSDSGVRPTNPDLLLINNLTAS